MRKAVRAIIVRNDELLVMRRNKFGKIYVTLPGGGVDSGETPDQALWRELEEETGVIIAEPRLVYLEDAGEMYGVQHIYLCRYISGEPELSENSEEALISKIGQNLYQPDWLKIADLPETEFLSPRLKERLIADLVQGFPAETTTIH
jgi:8-oxo-dGTP diphosphatase